MKTSASLPLVLAALWIAGSRPIPAAETQLPASLRPCMQQQDATQRLQCFDREAAKLAGTPAVASVPAPAPPVPAVPPARAAVSPAPPTVASAVTPAPAAGLGAEQVQRNTKRDPAAPEENLTATITALRNQTGGAQVISLDNDQVWRQAEAGPGGPLKVGDVVQISKGAMGFYRLKSDAAGPGRWTRVMRVR